jgi:hypothetical protein
MAVDEKTGIDFPLFQSQLEDVFGEPNYDDFVQNYIAFIDLSEFQEHLKHVANFHQGKRFGFSGNYILEDPFKAALQKIIAEGLADEIHSFEGCFNIRPMKSGGTPSVHSWGLALDMDASTNPFSWTKLTTSWSKGFVKCMTSVGFEWGGLWTKPFDAMHFQLPWIRDWRQSQNPLRPLVWPGSKA